MGYEWYITPEHYSIALKNGISQDLVTKRVRESGWDIQRAVTTPPQKRTNYDNWIATAKKNGISSLRFRKRVNAGWTCERAASEPVLSHSEIMLKTWEAKRVYSREYLDLAERNGICYSTLRARMRQGWSLEEACRVKVMTMSEAGKRKRRKMIANAQ